MDNKRGGSLYARFFSGLAVMLFLVVPTAFAAPAMPANPSPGTVSGPGPTLSSATVGLSWSAVSGASSYRVAVRDLVSYALVVDTSTTAAGYTAYLSPGHPYRWNTAACNAYGCSSYTTALYFQTATTSLPLVPTNTTPGTLAQPGPILGATTVTFSWGAVSGAMYYHVSARDLVTGVLVVDQSTSTAAYTASLTAGRPHRWVVSACNAAGCSATSDIKYFQTPSFPAAPSQLSPGTASSPGPSLAGGGIAFTWGAVANAMRYNISVRDLISNTLVVNQFVTTTTYNVPLVAGRQFRWTVSACNSIGCSPTNPVLYFQTVITSGDLFTWATSPLNPTNGHWYGDLFYVSDAPNRDTTTVWYDAQPFHHGNTHLGGDFNLGSGDYEITVPQDVYPVAKGTILKVYENLSGWGNVILVLHKTSFGDYTSLYGHVQWHPSIGKPVEGTTVYPTAPIARVGQGKWTQTTACPLNSYTKSFGFANNVYTCGYSAHLHLEIRRGSSTLAGPGYAECNGVDSSSNTCPQGQIDPNVFIAAHN